MPGATPIRAQASRLFCSLLPSIVSVALLAGASYGRAADEPLPAGQPCWFPLGDEVYHAQDRLEAEKQVLRFKSEPRWFLPNSRFVSREEYLRLRGAQSKRAEALSAQLQWPDTAREAARYAVPTDDRFPRSIGDLKMVDQGASLDLRAEPSQDRNTIRLTISLRAQSRPIEREVEHRWTNSLPLLFAFWVDGKPVRKELEGGWKFGGVNQQVILVDKNHEKIWRLRIDRKSLEQLIASQTGQRLQFVAAFSERQHEGQCSESEHRRLDTSLPTPHQPPILIRSNVVTLARSEGTWELEKHERPSRIPHRRWRRWR